MKVNVVPITLAIILLFVFLSLYDVSLASGESKAYMTLLCGALFFAASIASTHGGPWARTGSEAVAWLATLIVAALILFSMPIPISMLSPIPRQTVTIANTSNGTLFGPSAVITVDAVNAELSLVSWNNSEYSVVSEVSAHGLTKKSAERVLEKCKVKINDYAGDIEIFLTGPERLHRRVSLRQVIKIPRSVTPIFVLTATNGSVNLSGLSFEKIDVWLGSGPIQGRELRARSCEVMIDNGPIDLETESRELDLRTISGDIRLISLSPEVDCIAESVNGKIEVYLNFSKGIGYRIEADSLGGSISVNLTGLVFTKQRSGFIEAMSKDFVDMEKRTIVSARTTTGNVTVAQI